MSSMLGLAAALAIIGGGLLVWPTVALLRAVNVDRQRRLGRIFRLHLLGLLFTGGCSVYAHVAPRGDPYMSVIPMYVVEIISAVASASRLGGRHRG